VGEFGEKLRRQREQRGITLESVSDTTKIGTRMLKALEDERFDQLPGGVFNKGFVRAYARHIGLDAEEAVTEYLDALRESQARALDIMPEFRTQHPEPAEHPVGARSRVDDMPAPAFPRDIPKDPRPDPRPNLRVAPRPPGPQPQAAPEPRPEPGPTVPSQKPEERGKDLPLKKIIERRPAQPNLTPGIRIPWGIVAVALLLVALLLAFLSYHPRSVRSAASPPPVASPAPSAPQPPAAGSSRSSPVTPKSANTTASPAASQHTQPPTSSSEHAPATASPPATVASASDSATTPSAARESSTPTPSAGNRPAANSSSPVPAPATAPFQLLIRAEETSWVSIAVDGKPVAHETLIAPAGTSVRANREIEVRAGNAAGLQFVLNGKPLPRQGGPGEVRTFVFDSNGVHTILPTTQTPQ